MHNILHLITWFMSKRLFARDRWWQAEYWHNTVLTWGSLHLQLFHIVVSSPSQRQRSQGEHSPVHATSHHQSRSQRGQGSSSKCQKTGQGPAFIECMCHRRVSIPPLQGIIVGMWFGWNVMPCTKILDMHHSINRVTILYWTIENNNQWALWVMCCNQLRLLHLFQLNARNNFRKINCY